MKKRAIESDRAPAAIGTYSQAIRAGDMVFLSGQIPLDPATMSLVGEDIDAQIRQVLDNLAAVSASAGGTLDDIVKLTVYLVDLAHFGRVNEIMAQYFQAPYPARAAVEVAGLPRGAAVEMDAIMLAAD